MLEGISSLDFFSDDESLALLPNLDLNTSFNVESSDLFAPDDPGSGISLSNDNLEVSMNDCSLAFPQSRRARKRIEQCVPENPGDYGNPSLEVPTSSSALDWAQDALQRKWCSETTSLIFGNIPVCAVDAIPVTGLFENVNSYLSKYKTTLF